MPFDLLAIGDVSIDQYMHLNPKDVSVASNSTQLCFETGSKIPINQFRATIAGNACNNSIACTKLGMKVAIYSEFGADPNGDKFMETFDKVEIDRSLCVQDPGNPTNVHSILVFGNERTILSHHSERCYDMYRTQEWFKKQNNPKWVYYTSMCPNFEEFQAGLVAYLKNNKDIGVAFNPGSFHLKKGLDSLRNFLEVTHVLFVNMTEAEEFVGKHSLGETHIKLRELGPKMTVITNGKKGSSAFDGNNLQELGIFETEMGVVDKTGAGDAHSSGFLAALNYGKNIKEALIWGTLNSAHVITKIGSVHGLLDLQEITRLSQDNNVLKSLV